MEVKEFIQEALGKPRLWEQIEIADSTSGFSCHWIKDGGKYKYVMYLPKNKQNLSFANRLTILHEVGHIIFNDLFYNEPTKLTKILDKMLQHRFCYFLQGVWYWNPMIRWFKRKLGFSTILTYSKKDLYDEKVSKLYTRQDNEYFCDMFALFVKKYQNFLLDS